MTLKPVVGPNVLLLCGIVVNETGFLVAPASFLSLYDDAEEGKGVLDFPRVPLMPRPHWHDNYYHIRHLVCPHSSQAVDYNLECARCWS